MTGRLSLGIACVLALVSMPATGGPQASRVERGHYLAQAGDCVACHTARGGKPFAGGRALKTPFGIIYSPNITPDPETGIGDWTAKQFRRAMQSGIGSDGEHLYPAFPYPFFTRISDADLDAIRAYLNTLQPVRKQRRKNRFPWPFSMRSSLTVWDLLYLDEGRFESEPKHDAQWNRGAYLVTGLGHCGACHTPRNFMGARKTGKRFGGAMREGWYAPNLTSDPRVGLGKFSAGQIAEFLKTGFSPVMGAASGPMKEVVHDSLQHLRMDDLRAMAVYLKSLPSASSAATRAREQPEARKVGRGFNGKHLFHENCAECHGDDGKGRGSAYPPLAGNPVVQSPNPANVIQVLRHGGFVAATQSRPEPYSMPPFGDALSRDQLLAVVNYIRNAWGNSARLVTRQDLKHPAR